MSVYALPRESSFALLTMSTRMLSITNTYIIYEFNSHIVSVREHVYISVWKLPQNRDQSSFTQDFIPVHWKACITTNWLAMPLRALLHQCLDSIWRWMHKIIICIYFDRIQLWVSTSFAYVPQFYIVVNQVKLLQTSTVFPLWCRYRCARAYRCSSYSFVVVIVKGMADEISGSMTFGSGRLLRLMHYVR